MSDLMTHIEREERRVAEWANDVTPFTLADRKLITETHEAIVSIAVMLGEVVPKLESNPMFRMLGLGKR